jgi:hypothetical protein
MKVCKLEEAPLARKHMAQLNGVFFFFFSLIFFNLNNFFQFSKINKL